jgi:Mrp family chromosome partitioning ATPase
VLAIDGDLRRPSLDRLFGADANGGLVHVLRGEGRLDERVTEVVSHPSVTEHAAWNGSGGAPLGSVDLLAHGEVIGSPLPLIDSAPMRALLDEAVGKYDIVLIDTPPVLVVADAVPLLTAVDGVLVVARLGQTTRQAARRFTELVERLGQVKVLGIVANDHRAEADDGYGTYGSYGYAYSYKARTDTTRSPASADPLHTAGEEPLTAVVAAADAAPEPDAEGDAEDGTTAAASESRTVSSIGTNRPRRRQKRPGPLCGATRRRPSRPVRPSATRMPPPTLTIRTSSSRERFAHDPVAIVEEPRPPRRDRAR